MWAVCHYFKGDHTHARVVVNLEMVGQSKTVGGGSGDGRVESVVGVGFIACLVDYRTILVYAVVSVSASVCVCV